MKKILAFLVILTLGIVFYFTFETHAFAATCTAKDGDLCDNNNCCATGFTCVIERSSNVTISVCRPSNNTNESGKKVTPTPSNAPVIPPSPPCAKPVANAQGGCSGVNTAFGFWSTNPSEFVTSLMSILMGIAGGIAVLLIIASGYTMIMSQGDPEKIQGAKERLTAAIIGLLFLIFSVVILEIIGVDILHLPGFNH